MELDYRVNIFPILWLIILNIVILRFMPTLCDYLSVKMLAVSLNVNSDLSLCCYKHKLNMPVINMIKKRYRFLCQSQIIIFNQLYPQRNNPW